MAIIKRGILGGVQNKIGNVVGSSWKGIATLRSLPISVSNPNTAAQMAQRGKFKTMSQYGSALLATIIKPLMDRFAQQESGYNVFVRTNLPNYVDESTGNVPALQISNGTLAKAPTLSASVSSSNSLMTVTWGTSIVGDGSATDQAYIAVVHSDDEKGTAEGFAAVAARSAGTATIQLTNCTDNANFVVSLAFRKTDGSKVSDTANYAGTVSV